jgi:predicted dehydrogenase
MVQAIRGVPGHAVVAVASRRQSRAQEWAGRHGVPTVCEDFQALLECPEVDALYVALPPSLHTQWSFQGLLAGKVVLCEKPMGISRDDLGPLLGIAQQHAGKLHHATGFLHHPRSHALRDWVRSGRLGSVRRVTIGLTFAHVLQRGDDHRLHAELGGGCLLDLGWYCALSCQWLTGQRPHSLVSYADHQNGIPIHVQTMARLDGGATASWDCGFDAAGRKWIEIACEHGSIICDDWIRAWDAAKPRFWIHGHDGKAEAHVVGAGFFQEEQMVSACQVQTPADLDLATERLQLADDTHRTLDAIAQSIRTGREVPIAFSQ